MTLTQLEHVLRACGSIAGCREIIVIGSQALLASSPHAPDELLRWIFDFRKGEGKRMMLRGIQGAGLTPEADDALEGQEDE